ncbi:MAG: hypothetical protein JW936_09800 [Sedimentisphaerales bacterium]|nr:hypothetical protein [Sedimentisphaerales bacterium]
MARRKVVRRLIISMVVFILLCGIALYVMYSMITHRPAAYAPRQLTAQQREEATDRGVLKFNELYNAVHELEPFSITLEQNLINDLLVVNESQPYWQEVVERSGGRLGLPQIEFAQGVMRLMVLVVLEDIEAVITLELLPEMNGDGQLILSVGDIHAGAMPVPKSILQDYLSRAVSGLRDVSVSDAGPLDDQADSEERLADHFGRWAIPALVTLVDEQQVLVPTEVPIDVDRWARIKDVRVGAGTVEFDLEPYVE